MSANTRREKNDDLAKFASLYAQAVTFLEKGKRSPMQVEALFRAMQYFKENRLLAAIPKPPKDVLPEPEQLRQLLSLPLLDTDINRKTSTLLRKRGVQYVGELFLIKWGFSDTAKTVEKFLYSIGLAPDLDLTEFDWTPPYADKKFFWLMNQPPALFMVETSFPNDYPYRWFNQFQHMGELLQNTKRNWFDHGLFPMESFHRLFKPDVKLRAGLYCPKSWTPPPDPPK